VCQRWHQQLSDEARDRLAGHKPSALTMPMSRWLVSTALLTTLATTRAAVPSAKTARASKNVKVNVVVRPKICWMSK
jgi:hypothetical protein